MTIIKTDQENLIPENEILNIFKKSFTTPETRKPKNIRVAALPIR